MARYFSVDWLAQSHRSAQDETHGDHPTTGRPHIPCMVQPRQPSYGKSYLQPKPRKCVEVEETNAQQHTSPCSPLRQTACTSPISEGSGYSSGYDSEAASTEWHSVDEGGHLEKDAPLRRVRTKFTPEQIGKLEKIFAKHKYLDAGERVKTAQKLDLTETQVRTWFQNRRMKMKREVQDFAPQVPPVMFQHLPRLQYHGVGVPGPRYPPAATGFYAPPVQQLIPHYRHPHLLIPPFY